MRNELNSPASATRSTMPKRSAMTWNSTIGYAAKEKLLSGARRSPKTDYDTPAPAKWVMTDRESSRRTGIPAPALTYGQGLGSGRPTGWKISRQPGGGRKTRPPASTVSCNDQSPHTRSVTRDMRGFEVWGRPETYLNPAIRAALGEFERDLASGEWNRRYGHLRGLCFAGGQSLCLVALGAPTMGLMAAAASQPFPELARTWTLVRWHGYDPAP